MLRRSSAVEQLPVKEMVVGSNPTAGAKKFIFMDYIVYILLSKKDNKLYVGQTSNLEKRLNEHCTGKVFSTQKRLPLILIHKENFDSRKNAMKREKFLKSLYGAKEKQKILKEFLSNGSSKI